MKMPFSTFLFLIVGSLLAENPKEKTIRSVSEYRNKGIERAGGLVVYQPITSHFIFLNSQSQVSEKNIRQVSETLTSLLQYSFVIRSENIKDPIKKVVEITLQKNTAAVVLICEDPSLPSLLIAPEARWALVNVTALELDRPTADKLAERLRKEMWRAFAMLMGAAHTQRNGCVLTGVTSISDLDAVQSETICPDPFPKIVQHAEKLGMKHYRTTTYLRACEEGWAPMPTNATQRAIWDQVQKKAKNTTK